MPFPTASYPATPVTNALLFGPVPDFGNLRLSGVHTAATPTITTKTAIPTYWPQPGILTIDGEDIEYQTYSGSVFSTLTRGRDSDVGGGIAAAHSDNALVSFRHVGHRQNKIHAELIAIETALRAVIGGYAAADIVATVGYIRIPNNTAINARNAANNANGTLIASDASNVVQIGDAATFTWSQFPGGIILVGATPATTGAIRMGNAQYIYGRNAANNANIQVLGLGGNDQIQLNGALVQMDIGASFGAIPATVGTMRTVSAFTLSYRNAANGANINALADDGANNVILGSGNAGALPAGGVYAYDVTAAAVKQLKTEVADGTGHLVASRRFWSTGGL